MANLLIPTKEIIDRPIISVTADTLRHHRHLRYSIQFDAYTQRKITNHLGVTSLASLLRALRDIRERVGVLSLDLADQETLTLIVVNLFVAWATHGNPFVAVPLGRIAYASGTRLHALHLKISKVKKVISALAENGLIEVHPGYYDRKQKEGRCTRIRVDTPMGALFRKHSMDVRHIFKITPLVNLRDKNKKNINIDRGRHAAEAKKFYFALNEINAMLAGTEIKLEINETEFIRNYVLASEGRKEPCAPPNPCAVKLYRVFNGDFNHGGRFYGGWWQSIAKALRAQLAINGSPVVELDYKSLHPSMLYLREGITLENDPYIIPEYGASFRPIFKILLNCAINATTPAKAKAAVRKAIAETPCLLRTFRECLLNTWLNPAWEALVKNHAPIASYLGSGEGLRLQRIDSDMAEHVMLTLLRQGIPVLCIHDSFIVANAHEQALKSAMIDAAQARVGGVIPIENKMPQNSLFIPKIFNNFEL